MSLSLVKRHLKFAINADKQFSRAHFELAKIFLDENKHHQAIKELKRAIKSETQKFKMYESRGKALLEKKQFSQAKQFMYKNRYALYECSIYLSMLAEIYVESKEYNKAKQYAKKSIELYSDQWRSMLVLAQVFFQQQKWKFSIDWLDKSLELNFKHYQSHLLMAKTKQKQNKKKDAIFHYLIAKDLNPQIKFPPLDALIPAS